MGSAKHPAESKLTKKKLKPPKEMTNRLSDTTKELTREKPSGYYQIEVTSTRGGSKVKK